MIIDPHCRILYYFLHAPMGPTEACGWVLKYLSQYFHAL